MLSVLLLLTPRFRTSKPAFEDFEGREEPRGRPSCAVVRHRALPPCGRSSASPRQGLTPKPELHLVFPMTNLQPWVRRPTCFTVAFVFGSLLKRLVIFLEAGSQGATGGYPDSSMLA